MQKSKEDVYVFTADQNQLKKMECKLKTLIIKQINSLHFTDGTSISRDNKSEKEISNVLNY